MVFKFILVIGGWDISHEISSRWMTLDLTDDKSTLVQVMAWCHQATSHYLNQCWPRYASPYGVTRPQWVNGVCSRLSFIEYIIPTLTHCDLVMPYSNIVLGQNCLQLWLLSGGPNHYSNQCWLIISAVQWQLPDGNFITDTSVINC